MTRAKGWIQSESKAAATGFAAQRPQAVRPKIKNYPREKKPKTGPTILVIPDSHATPEVDNRRYEWAGRFAAQLRPDYIVDIGDHFDMRSLNKFEKGPSMIGASYWADIEAGIDARLRFNKQIEDQNKKLSKSKKYKPEKIFCLGNHENRVDRFLSESMEGSRFANVIGRQDFESEALGWREIDYMKPTIIEGVSFAHAFVSGVLGKPVSGVHQAASLVSKHLTSCVMGHTHTYDHAVRAQGGAENPRHVHGLVVGVFTEEEMNYSGPQASALWRRGLVVLHNVSRGDFDVETISMERLASRFG